MVVLSSEKTKYLVQFIEAPSFIYEQLDGLRARMDRYFSAQEIVETMAYLTSMFSSQTS